MFLSAIILFLKDSFSVDFLNIDLRNVYNRWYIVFVSYTCCLLLDYYVEFTYYIIILLSLFLVIDQI